MSSIPDDVREDLDAVKGAIMDRLSELKTMADTDVVIDEFDIDRALLDTPKLYSKWLSYYTDETMNLKDLYGLKERVKLERWKYYMGKQEPKYYARYGNIHEKILKTDLDKYLAADEKLSIVNDVVTAQKALVDYIEKTLKEIGNRGFHCKSIIDWRRFTGGS